MKTSTEIYSLSRIVGAERAIEYVAKAGFDAYDLSLFKMVDYDWEHKCFKKANTPLGGSEYLKYVRNLKRIADDCGIICNQSHAPYPSSCPEIREYFKRSIECTAEVGGEICVIHPNENGSMDENVEMYCELLPFAKGHNVKIAMENIYEWDSELNQAKGVAGSSPESLVSHLNAVNDSSFVACLDIGHAEMRGLDTSSVQMIYTLGKHLQALHIHDTDKWQDNHQIPYSMDIDFLPIIKALKDINYTGYFTLEAATYLNAYNEDNVFDGVKKLEEAVRKMANTFDAV